MTEKQILRELDMILSYTHRPKKDHNVYEFSIKRLQRLIDLANDANNSGIEIKIWEG